MIPCRSEGFGCLGVGLYIFLGVAVAMVIAAWPVMWLFRVRPAWRVALLGPFVVAGLYYVITLLPLPSLPDLSPEIPVGALCMAIGYAVAAWTTAPDPDARPYPWPLRLAPLAVVAVLTAATGLVYGLR
ncbi:hypothetical protein OIE66_33335 [Nonomuraea sp. NBC_01738]|uniref:hypothetical protein n=1 Tax=Nonomuraea sp. NBC_01738 TaxID=2976003 RepID=UPI002E0DEA0C|nr:hypothetical protein OIE66_33335 [Nonomuraea sp. NBC_01738]